MASEMKRPSDVLTNREVDAVVDFFLHNMSMQRRYQLMREFPAIYNKLFGQIVKVVFVSDFSDIPKHPLDSD